MKDPILPQKEATWNVTTGCTKISAGCTHCRAEKMAERLQANGLHKYRNGFRLTLHPQTLQIPYNWKTPRMVFVNPMSDLFHADIPLDYIKEVFRVMNDTPQHSFQILTKRAGRLAACAHELNWGENISIGVTVEAQAYAWRAEVLKNTGAKHRFLAVEPMVGEISNISLKHIDWVTAGGATGQPADGPWLQNLKEACPQQGTAFFYKQRHNARQASPRPTIDLARLA